MKKFIALLFFLFVFLFLIPVFAGDLPNPTLTPGVVDTNVTNEQLCLSGYTGTVRNVSAATKKKVFAEYKVDPKSDKFEIDHLVSLEIGGKNDIANLWNQSYTTQPWNAHVKDKLENRLHKLVCDGVMPLNIAQEKIRTDWILTYCEVYSDKKTECDDYKKGIK